MNYTEKEIIKLIDDGTIEKLIKFKKVKQRIKEICEQNPVSINTVLIQIAEILSNIISSSDNYSGEISDKVSKLWDYINILEIKNEKKT
jgi:flagellin-specific chaperone FliS